MPYNTNAIPPRKEATGQTQLPLSRVKKIVGQDQDITMCSNNAAFVITLATEMFIQHLATEGLNCAKLERKPRRNIQYKDIANAVSHQDNLEFLSDMVPKTVPFKKVRAQATATRSALDGAGENPAAAAAAVAAATKATGDVEEEDRDGDGEGKKPNGKKHKASHAATAAAAPPAPAPPSSDKKKTTTTTKQQSSQKQKKRQSTAGADGGSGAGGGEEEGQAADPNDQLQLEMRQAHDGGDVEMTG